MFLCWKCLEVVLSLYNSLFNRNLGSSLYCFSLLIRFLSMKLLTFTYKKTSLWQLIQTFLAFKCKYMCLYEINILNNREVISGNKNCLLNNDIYLTQLKLWMLATFSNIVHDWDFYNLLEKQVFFFFSSTWTRLSFLVFTRIEGSSSNPWSKLSNGFNKLNLSESHFSTKESLLLPNKWAKRTLLNQQKQFESGTLWKIYMDRINF
jgi:hypothetical protein